MKRPSQSYISCLRHTACVTYGSQAAHARQPCTPHPQHTPRALATHNLHNPNTTCTFSTHNLPRSTRSLCQDTDRASPATTPSVIAPHHCRYGHTVQQVSLPLPC